MTIDLNAIKKRAEAATEGPWSVNDYDDVESQGGPVFGTTDHVTWENQNAEADAAFIAHARQDVPALIAEVERLRSELSFIANVDLTKNAYDIEHVAVSVKSWAINVLDGRNHDD